MAASQQRTRAQLRQSVGLRAGKIWQDNGVTSSPTDNGNAGEILDANLAFGTEDEHRGKWIWATDSAGASEQRRVLKSDPSEARLEPSVQFSATPNSSWTYELWDHGVSPTQIHEYLNQAITEADRKGAVPLTSDTFHSGGGVYAWGLSSAIAGVRFVEKRVGYVGEQVFNFDTAPSSLISQVDVTLDTEDYREGQGAAKINLGTGASAGFAIAGSTFSAVNLSGYTHMDVWMKSNVALNSSALHLRLFEGSSAKEIMFAPSLGADSWTRVNLAFSTPENNSAITSIRLTTGNSWADTNTAIIWLDDAIAYRDNAEEWSTLHHTRWSVDRDRRELRIDPGAVGYNKLQVTGVQLPSLLTTDTQIVDIDPQYVVTSALAQVYEIGGDSVRSNRAAAQAFTMKAKMKNPSNIKWVDN